MYRLPQPLDPRRGEALAGYTRSLSEINGMSLSQMLGVTGIGRIFPSSDDAAFTALAVAGGTTMKKLERLRQRPSNDGAKGAVSVLGHTLRPTHIGRGRMRVCPECIRTGGTIREAWSILYVTSCPQHGCLLVDQCDGCGRDLHMHFTAADYPWACVCEKEYADIAVTPATSASMDVARILYPLIGRTEITGLVSLAKRPDESIAPFDNLGLNDLLATIDLIGTVATTKAQDDPAAEDRRLPYGTRGPARSTGDFLARAEAAIDIMRRWPITWHDLLDELARRSPPGNSHIRERAILATHMGRRCLAPDRDITGVPLRLIAAETARWFETRHGITRRRQPYTSKNAVARIIGRTMSASKTARTLGIEGYLADFKRIYNEVLATMETEGCRGNPASVGADLMQRVQARWNDHGGTVSSISACEMLEGVQAEKSLSGWQEAGMISQATEFEGLARKRKASYRISDIERLLAKMQDVSTRVENLVGLDRVTTGIMRRTLTPHYAKAELLRDVLSGRLPTYRTVDKPRLDDLHADLVFANRIAVAHRAIALDEADVMLAAKPLNNMIGVIWGNDRRLGIKESRDLREAGVLRFERTIAWNATEQRSHPLYAYSVRDTLRHFTVMMGPSGIDELDRHLSNEP